jgi:hypothetical protein
MRTRLVSVLALSLALAMIGGFVSVEPATAQGTSCSAVLNGVQETPPVATTATGTGRVVFNATEDQIVVNLLFSGLSSPQTLAHIHGPATPGVAAGIQIPLPNGPVANQVFAVTPAQRDMIRTGLTYFNVHTQNFPNGEIRGQITCAGITPIVPELSTVLMFGTGLAGLGGYALTRARAARARRR